MTVAECKQATEYYMSETDEHISICHTGHFLFMDLSFWSLNCSHFTNLFQYPFSHPFNYTSVPHALALLLKHKVEIGTFRRQHHMNSTVQQEPKS